jgi:two-component system, sensor histidine kinase and response regulator
MAAARTKIENRTEALFRADRMELWQSTDRLFATLILLQWVAGIVAAIFISPRAWAGVESQVHPHVWAALFGGGLIASLPIGLALRAPGSTTTRQTIAVAQGLTSALLIHLLGGRIETHFHVFGSLAFLAIYQDWRVLVTYSAVVAVDHLVRGYLWPQSVYGVLTASPWRALEHAGWVLFEDSVLFIAIRRGVRSTWELATRQAEAEQVKEQIEAEVRVRTSELARSEERFRSLAAASPMGIFQFDASGSAIWANQRWSDLICLAPEESLGDGWFRTLHPEDKEDVVKLWAERRDSDDLETEYRILRESGEVRWVQARSRPMRDADGRITGYVGTGADVTERRRAAEELVRAKEAAVAGSRAKSEFLATMSHEIRTPMNAVIGMTTLLLDTDLGAEQRDSLETIRSSGESLLGIINQILDFSKIEEQKLVLEERSFDLRTCVGKVMEMLAPQANAKGLAFTCEFAADVPRLISSDDTRIRQILVNLIGNAIKFTEQGEVRVRVGSKPSSGGRCALRIEVEDSGIGMTPEEVQRIFEAFRQGDGSTTRRYGGTGLGLAISKRLAELLGGELSAEGRPGVGSTFVCTMTVALVAGTALREEEGPALRRIDRDLAERAPLRVLLAEDNRVNQKVALAMLRRMGYEADLAVNGLEAVAALEREPYDLVLMDMQMPEMDGIQATRELRRRLSAERQPQVVALTANASDGDRTACLAAGMDGFLAKPVSLQALAEVLEQAAARTSAFVAATGPPAAA